MSHHVESATSHLHVELPPFMVFFQIAIFWPVAALFRRRFSTIDRINRSLTTLHIEWDPNAALNL